MTDAQPAPAPSITLTQPAVPADIMAALTAPPQAPAGPANPGYYSRFKIQPITFIRENNLPFWSANVVKYVCREDAKNGLEDIEKAIEYLLKERAYLKGEPDWMLATLKQ